MFKGFLSRLPIGVLLGLLLLSSSFSTVKAANPCVEENIYASVSASGGFPITGTGDRATLKNPTDGKLSVTFTIRGLKRSGEYDVGMYWNNKPTPDVTSNKVVVALTTEQPTAPDIQLTLNAEEISGGSWNFDLRRNNGENCEITKVKFDNVQRYRCENIKVWQTRTMSDGKQLQCYYNGSANQCMEEGAVINYSFDIVNIDDPSIPFPHRDRTKFFTTENSKLVPVDNGSRWDAGIYDIRITTGEINDVNNQLDRTTCENIPVRISNYCEPLSTYCGTEGEIPDNNPVPAEDLQFALCSQASDTLLANSGRTQQKECEYCYGKEGVWTAVGCIEFKPQPIIQAVVRIGIGIGGGIALLMTLVGGFLLTTSQGDPKRTQEGKDMITSSVIGIIFVLFSVVILQFIGVRIFQLPGFGTI